MEHTKTADPQLGCNILFVVRAGGNEQSRNFVYPWDWEWFSESDAVAGWPLHCELSSKPSGYVAGSDKMKCGSIPHPGDLGTTNAPHHGARMEKL